MTMWKWSTDPATNGSADATCPWPEGMAPSQVNDSARGGMAAVAKYRDDISGKLVTSGTNTAYTIASNQGFDSLAHLDGAMIAFIPHVTNGATPTLNVDGLGAKTIRGQSGVDLAAGTLQEGTHYVVTYNNTSAEFVLHSFNPGEIPIGSGIDYWGATVPSSNFAFAYGQAISRADYPICFARLGTTYGSGDGSTTFNLPDKRGRVSAASDGMGGSDANRLTTSTMSTAGAGGTGGVQTQSIAQANLPNINLSSASLTANTSLSNNSAVHRGSTATGSYQSQIGGTSVFTATDIAVNNIGATTTISGVVPLGGSGVAMSNVQPTIICNYIIRIK